MRVVYVAMKFYRLVDVDSEVLPFKKANNKKLNYKVRAYQLYSSSHNNEYLPFEEASGKKPAPSNEDLLAEMVAKHGAERGVVEFQNAIRAKLEKEKQKEKHLPDDGGKGAALLGLLKPKP